LTTSEKHRIKALVDINVVVAKWRHMKVELALSLDNFTYLFICVFAPSIGVINGLGRVQKHRKSPLLLPDYFEHLL
jgi:hypothetical protein